MTEDERLADGWVRLSDVEEGLRKATEALEGEIDRLTARIAQLEPQEGDQWFSRANLDEALATAIGPFEREIGRLQERFRELYVLLQPGGSTLDLATNRRIAVRLCSKEGGILG